MKTSPAHFIIQNRKLQRAYAILISILEGMEEIEQDKEIYHFLKENNQLPNNYVPYWDETEHPCLIDLQMESLTNYLDGK